MRAHEITEAHPSRVSQLSEYLSEAVPPVGLPPGFRVVADRSLPAQEVLYFAAGEATAIVKLRGTDLVKATGAKIARIARPPASTAGDSRRSRPVA